MQPLTIALLQLTACGNDTGANLAKGEAFCRRAAMMGADLALFPEMWSAGYTPAGAFNPDLNLWRGPAAGEIWEVSKTSQVCPPPAPSPEAIWQDLPVARDGPFVSHFRELARELQMAIVITYLEQWPGAPRNTVSIIDGHGEIALTYAKVHTCDWSPNEACLTPGADFPVCTLDTRHGEVRLGAMICYDREFPESARLLMLGGAEIILVPNACELEEHRLHQLKTRAFENMVGVALANYAGPGMGHSVAYDPVAFNQRGSRSTLVVAAGEAEGVYLAPFDMAQIRAYRGREVWGNAFRRPHRYAALTGTAVAEPFVRVNADGERYDTEGR